MTINSIKCLLGIKLPVPTNTNMFAVFVSQAFSVARFLWHYAIPVAVFAFCYGRIFYTVRRQSKVVSGHAGQSRNIAMRTITISHDQNAGQIRQQATGTTSYFHPLPLLHLPSSHLSSPVLLLFLIIIITGSAEGDWKYKSSSYCY